MGSTSASAFSDNLCRVTIVPDLLYLLVILICIPNLVSKSSPNKLQSQFGTYQNLCILNLSPTSIAVVEGGVAFHLSQWLLELLKMPSFSSLDFVLTRVSLETGLSLRTASQTVPPFSASQHWSLPGLGQGDSCLVTGYAAPPPLRDRLNPFQPFPPFLKVLQVPAPLPKEAEVSHHSSPCFYIFPHPFSCLWLFQNLVNIKRLSEGIKESSPSLLRFLSSTYCCTPSSALPFLLSPATTSTHRWDFFTECPAPPLPSVGIKCCFCVRIV